MSDNGAAHAAMPLRDDNPSKVDLLGFEDVVDVVESIVTRADLDPVTVGVNAPWGGGKTTVLQLLKRRLDAREDAFCLLVSPWEAAWIAGSSGLFGALVGVAGTTIVGVVSSRATRNATLAAIEADQHARVWEKRAATYADVLALMRTSADSRQVAFEGLLTGGEHSWSAEPEGWPETQDRVLAFSSDAVRDAFAASMKADTNFHVAVSTRGKRQAMEEAMFAALRADHDLVQTIRSELQAGPPGQARPRWRKSVVREKRAIRPGEASSRVTGS